MHARGKPTGTFHDFILFCHRTPRTSVPGSAGPHRPRNQPPVLLPMPVACDLCAGSNYFNQQLLHSIATQLQVRDASAALIESASLNLKYPFGLSLSKPCAALRQAQRERFK